MRILNMGLAEGRRRNLRDRDSATIGINTNYERRGSLESMTEERGVL